MRGHPRSHDGVIAIGQYGLDELIARARACTRCADALPLGPRPVLSVHPDARVLIVGQAPGTRVHETGIPWNDASGDRLRTWLDVDTDAFYDARSFAILPAGLCYPGRARGGDAPPRPECAPRWHPPLRAALDRVRLTLLVGAHAQRYDLGPARTTISQRVQDFAAYLPERFPLPHPSPRNRRWLSERPWFEAEVVPALRRAVADALSDA